MNSTVSLWHHVAIEKHDKHDIHHEIRLENISQSINLFEKSYLSIKS